VEGKREGEGKHEAEGNREAEEELRGREHASEASEVGQGTASGARRKGSAWETASGQ
jgi:hypothetical protein